jgi:uracil-DNA glycosylase family 4
MNPQAKEKVWLPVRNENCKLCPLSEGARSVCLLGDGPVPTPVMVVGEAPGAREDDIARPFSGVAGKYLDRVLQEVGLPRDSVYITNAVRCRPPENRTPSRSEIKACHGYMEDELRIVEPKFVLLLGNVALQAFTKRTGIMKKRGAIMQIDGRTVFPTLHPSAVLRNPAHEGIFKGDLLTFARLVRGEDVRPETQTALIKSSKGLAKLCQMLAAVETPIAFDVETGTVDMKREKGGLEPWAPDGVIHTVSFCWEPGKSFVVALEYPEIGWDIPIERVYEALNVALEGKKMVGHNIKFDVEWMRAKGVNLYAHFDTRIAAHILDENRPGGLKPLARSYLGADEYEAGVNFDSVTGLSRLAIYNGKDADYTLRLYHIFREDLKKHPKLHRLFVKLLMPACRAFAEIEQVGFPVDIERLSSRHAEIKEHIKSSTEKLLEFVPEERRHLANFRSTVFLGWFFFEHLKLPILLRSPKTQKPSTAEAVLLQLKKRHPAVAQLMELRKWQKYESTYTRNWLYRVSIARKPRLHTSYNISGTVTGRLSSDMQQVPRDVYIRSIIGTRPGWSFIEADFSQVELRLAAMFSRDPALTRAFQTGGDPHRETAAKVLGKPPAEITKDERKMAKAVNFGFLYGMGWKKFMTYADEKYDTKVTPDEAKAYRDAFFQQYVGLLPWHERQRRLVRNLQFVQSPIGRVRHLPSIMSTDEDLQAGAEREAINAPVQGFASDLTVLSMVLLHERLNPKRARILGNVHDAVLLEARDEYAEETAAIVKETMEHLPIKKLFGYEPTVPIEADVTISKHWGEH